MCTYKGKFGRESIVYSVHKLLFQIEAVGIGVSDEAFLQNERDVWKDLVADQTTNRKVGIVRSIHEYLLKLYCQDWEFSAGYFPRTIRSVNRRDPV